MKLTLFYTYYFKIRGIFLKKFKKGDRIDINNVTKAFYFKQCRF